MNNHINWASLYFLLFLLPICLIAQTSSGIIRGKVEATEGGEIMPLIGAKLFWLGTSEGTMTEEEGTFELAQVPETNVLIISYFGYQNDTLEVAEGGVISIRLETKHTLDEVEIVHKQKSTSISFIDPMKTENIGEKELLKAACCNLSESFETNPSVDVSFTDAVTGTRQIQLLGLAGPYSQITRENMPDVRGLSAIYGLTYVPGTWVESMQLNKGAGSVANGFESIAGQINIELRKPESSERMYLNLYANEGGKVEANANFAHKFEDGKWSTALLLHGKNASIKRDRNQDNFLDMPLSDQFIALNRWKYIGPNGLRLQLGVKGTYIDNMGGQIDFEPNKHALGNEKWGMHLNMQRLEAFTKIGKVFEDKPWRTYGLQVSAVNHHQDSYFGMNRYDARQQTMYANFMYQGIFSNTNHGFRTGASFMYDAYQEILNDVDYNRQEIVPGAYFEYTYSYLEKFGAVAGIRADHHNLFGAFITPRLHLRFAPTEKTVFRASAGRGQRTANIFSENNGLLASSRQFIIQGDGGNTPYGLQPEVAWNYGFNVTQYFTLDYRDGSASLDFYRTDFQNQIVVDREQSPQTVVFYNLEGESYSNSFQAQVDYEVIKRLDARLAYRWFDVKTAYDGVLMEKPLVSAHRAFLNLAYNTRNHWTFDYTLNWQGSKRLPFTRSNPLEYQLSERSPSFVVMNAQISKTFREFFEIYVGMENMLNYRQEGPILSSEQPFSPYFDSSMVWGPIFGRNTYVGLRYRVK
ncbi:MAG: TonB-dependent receptor [Bacteroidota bacterium]